MTKIMSFNYLKHYRLLKYAKTERLFVNRTESLATMLNQGYGYGVLTEEFSKFHVDAKQLIKLNNNKTYENNLMSAWYDRPETPPYFTHLLQAIS